MVRSEIRRKILSSKAFVNTPMLELLFLNRVVILSNKRLYSSQDEIPDLVRSRSGLNPDITSTVPTETSNSSQNERNINRSNYNN